MLAYLTRSTYVIGVATYSVPLAKYNAALRPDSPSTSIGTSAVDLDKLRWRDEAASQDPGLRTGQKSLEASRQAPLRPRDLYLARFLRTVCPRSSTDFCEAEHFTRSFSFGDLFDMPQELGRLGRFFKGPATQGPQIGLGRSGPLMALSDRSAGPSLGDEAAGEKRDHSTVDPWPVHRL